LWLSALVWQPAQWFGWSEFLGWLLAGVVDYVGVLCVGVKGGYWMGGGGG
jgi:hypothetical protein